MSIVNILLCILILLFVIFIYNILVSYSKIGNKWAIILLKIIKLVAILAIVVLAVVKMIHFS